MTGRARHLLAFCLPIGLLWLGHSAGTSAQTSALPVLRGDACSAVLSVPGSFCVLNLTSGPVQMALYVQRPALVAQQAVQRAPDQGEMVVLTAGAPGSTDNAVGAVLTGTSLARLQVLTAATGATPASEVTVEVRAGESWALVWSPAGGAPCAGPCYRLEIVAH